ncbi:MAG TPA: HAMP domain-containing histidine kinase [Epsilonproteobacteria bacterium]|nr:HAMP domain-containing histidine kinase [Campylobacterota bacterium]
MNKTGRHSLILHITLFFLFLVIVINLLLFVQYRLAYQQSIEVLDKRFHEAERVLDMSRMDRLPFEAAKERLYKILQIELLHPQELPDLSGSALLKKERSMTISLHKGCAYFVIDDPRRPAKRILRYCHYAPDQTYLLILALLINLVLWLFYLYMLRRLKPIRKLKQRIARFAEGETEIDTQIKGKDEIAELSRAFNETITKISDLQASRKLFLRNIMHELKTPIAKGKLITDLMEDPKNRARLQKIFLRFEYLLGEFTKIERVTSNVMTLEIKRYRVIDILDNALDILMVDPRSIIVEAEANLEIDADYELFSIALKNLIDNALKYGTGRPVILIEEARIVVASTGEKLENISFDKPFNRAYEGIEKGLGLGLYITQNIVRKHGFVFEYQHTDTTNKFIIRV